MMTIITKSPYRVLLLAVFIASGILVVKMMHRTPTPASSLTYTCFVTPKGWGYDILENGKTVIHQPVIPGMDGLTGFATQKQAAGIAGIVIEKIKLRQVPYISRRHLQEAGIVSAAAQ